MNYWVYKNTRSDVWSVRHKGKVLIHIKRLTIYNPTFKVWKSVIDKIRVNKRKTPCAFICSDKISYDKFKVPKHAREVIFNPYKYDTFVYADTEEPVINVTMCWMQFPKVYVI